MDNDTELIPTNVELNTAERFEPARYSLQDLRFLLEHLGIAPAVAMRKTQEPGVRARRVKALLTDVFNLEQIREAESEFKWAGIEALKDSIAAFIAWHDRSAEIKRRRIKDSTGAIVSHPSQYAWDEDGRAYKFAVDADSAEMVRTMINDDGTRRAFGVDLLRPSDEVGVKISDVAPWVKTGPVAQVKDEVAVTRMADKRLSALTCSVCGFMQQFPTSDRTKQNMAMVRMRKHMKDAKVNVNRHRLLLNKLAR